LEIALGFRLFDRTTRHVALTADGHKLLGVARSSLEDLDAAMARLGQASRETRHTLSLGAPPLIAANIVPHAIKEFPDQRPDLRIRLFDGDLATIRRRVETGKLDLGIGIFGQSAGIRRMPFFRFTLLVVRPESSPATARASTTWAALKNETLIGLPSTSPLQQVIDRHLEQAGAAARPVLVLNSLDTQIAMIEAGHGIGVIPSFGIPACRNRRVVMTRLTNPVVTVDYHQIQQRGKKPPAGAEEFAAFLQSYIARWAGVAGIL
jgi:DNA-binding transcriptional LysR family regulator